MDKSRINRDKSTKGLCELINGLWDNIQFKNGHLLCKDNFSNKVTRAFHVDIQTKTLTFTSRFLASYHLTQTYLAFNRKCARKQ